MACPPKLTIFYFIIYLVVQNDEVYCQYSFDGCEPSSGDLIGSLLKELGEKERILLLNALLSIATDNGIIPDLSPLIPSRTTANNVAQSNSVPQNLNVPLVGNIPQKPDETPNLIPPHNECQNHYGPGELVIQNKPTLNDIIFTICPAYGVADSPYIIPASTSSPGPTSLHSPSPSPSQSSNPSQSSSSSQSTSSSQATSSSQSIFSSHLPSSSQSSSSSHSSLSSISQPSSSHSPSSQLPVSQSESSSKTFAQSKQILNSSPSSPSSSQASPIKPKPCAPSHSSPPSLSKPSDKSTPSQITGSKPIGGTEITSNAGYPTNSFPYSDELPMNLEINLPAPNIPEPRITIITTPAPVEKKTSPLKKMLPLILIALLSNDRNNACPCIPSPSIVPIPYPIPIPFPSIRNFNDDDDDDDDTPKKTNRKRREDYDLLEQTYFMEARK